MWNLFLYICLYFVDVYVKFFITLKVILNFIEYILIARGKVHSDISVSDKKITGTLLVLSVKHLGIESYMMQQALLMPKWIMC